MAIATLVFLADANQQLTHCCDQGVHARLVNGPHMPVVGIISSRREQGQAYGLDEGRRTIVHGALELGELMQRLKSWAG